MSLNKFNHLYILLSIIVISLSACSNNANKSAQETTEINYEFKKGKQLSSKDWHCYNVDENRICIPSSWKMKQQDRFLFFSYLNTPDSNAYFVGLKHNKNISALSINKYIRETYNQLKNDSLELFTGYTLKKITFKEKESVYGEYYTKIDGKPYMTYSTVFDLDGYLFELALKVDSAKSNVYKNIYRDILCNFRHNNQPVFSAKDEILDIQIIDLSKNDW